MDGGIRARVGVNEIKHIYIYMYIQEGYFKKKGLLKTVKFINKQKQGKP